ncbi:MAG: YicC family protein [Polyangiaceae bacterium]|nr:YicC family protein [Polyangiaceae bacterium]MCW5791134.1 YicC family protein [Polyangiaceae bacterium]
MRSMTGIGVGTASLKGGRLVAELRSLNHRFFEVRLRLPPELQDHGAFLEQELRQKISRGRLDLGVRLEGTLTTQRFSPARAHALYLELASLRDELTPGAELPISTLAQFSEWLSAPTETDTAPLRQALSAALDHATRALIAMQADEGARLRAELLSRIERARATAKAIAQLCPEAVAQQEMRLRERVERLLAGTGHRLDPARLAMEVALLADKSDVTEELVRLRSHLDQFEALLSQQGPVGRRLDFLLQELAREANTLGSKCQDVTMSHLVVELKADLERLREQVQNVE